MAVVGDRGGRRGIRVHEQARLDELSVEEEALDHYGADGEHPLAGVGRARLARREVGIAGGAAVLDVDLPARRQHERARFVGAVGPQRAVHLISDGRGGEALHVRGRHAAREAQLANRGGGGSARARRRGRDAIGGSRGLAGVTAERVAGVTAERVAGVITRGAVRAAVGVDRQRVATARARHRVAARDVGRCFGRRHASVATGGGRGVRSISTATAPAARRPRPRGGEAGGGR